MRKQTVQINIIRDNLSPISENYVREFHESMKENNISHGIIMTTADVTPPAAEYAASRPIEIYDTSMLADQVRAAMQGQ